MCDDSKLKRKLAFIFKRVKGYCNRAYGFFIRTATSFEILPQMS